MRLISFIFLLPMSCPKIITFSLMSISRSKLFRIRHETTFQYILIFLQVNKKWVIVSLQLQIWHKLSFRIPHLHKLSQLGNILWKAWSWIVLFCCRYFDKIYISIHCSSWNHSVTLVGLATNIWKKADFEVQRMCGILGHYHRITTGHFCARYILEIWN